jgi:predicted thioredoxin/glutaredoxin
MKVIPSPPSHIGASRRPLPCNPHYAASLHSVLLFDLRRCIMGSRLDIYIEENCPGCRQAKEVALQVQQRMPQVEVRIHDLAHQNIKKPSSVFAVPTYLLDGKTVSLGNPDFNDLLAMLEGNLKS